MRLVLLFHRVLARIALKVAQAVGAAEGDKARSCLGAVDWAGRFAVHGADVIDGPCGKQCGSHGKAEEERDEYGFHRMYGLSVAVTTLTKRTHPALL